MRDRVCRWIAWRLPRGVVYWAAIRLVTFATSGTHSDQVVPALDVLDALERWKSRP
jgi:hypothetical protein